MLFLSDILNTHENSNSISDLTFFSMLIFIEMRDKIKKHLFCFNLVILKSSKFSINNI